MHVLPTGSELCLNMGNYCFQLELGRLDSY